MFVSTLPKCKATYVCHNQNKYAIKKSDIHKNKTKNEAYYDGIQRKQLELQTKAKVLCAREHKLQEKTRKFKRKAKKIQLIQRDIERKIDVVKKEFEYLVNAGVITHVKTDNFSNAPENIKCYKERKSSFRLIPSKNQCRTREPDCKQKREVPLCGKLHSLSKSLALPVFCQLKKENTKAGFDQLNRINLEDNYYSWRYRYNMSKRMPLIDHITVQQFLLYSSIAAVCSPCLLPLLILSSCLWHPFVK